MLITPNKHNSKIADAGLSCPCAVTFVLPSDGRSGGVRVTVIMANLLLKRGYSVRVVHSRQFRPSWRSRLAYTLGRMMGHSLSADGFLHEFQGPVEIYRDLDELRYASDEVVVAVGTYTVAHVRRMIHPVVKVRFNHGFPAKPNMDEEQAWRGEMLTVTVSNTLIPRLQELTSGNVWGVVPNGVDFRDYYIDESISREGIGALYSPHPNKSPENLISVLQEAHRQWPKIPQYVFGTGARPEGLSHVNYTRLPPVAQARAIYNSCKTWVLASKTEGLPGVVLEAMACGCVVVSSDNDGSRELIRHEHGGLLAPWGDTAAILAEVDRSLHDEALRRKLLAGAAEVVRAFSWERAVDRMEEFLVYARSLPKNRDRSNSSTAVSFC